MVRKSKTFDGVGRSLEDLLGKLALANFKSAARHFPD
jgi:hypothetical protein